MQQFSVTFQYETAELHSLVISGSLGFALPQGKPSPDLVTHLDEGRDYGQANQLQLHFKDGGRN